MKLGPSRQGIITAAAFAALSVCPGFAQTTKAELEKKVQEEERVMLTPFEVNEDKDVGFAASSSLAGARLSTPLKDTP